ncbi:MAG: hypothetical protein AMJ79_06890 [Phycisphaerae bacterium SM23_30]|nr:MAG: hypothetical protein AMJ79_06890 [Phycisphaerae bacterium SM23_30]
MPKTRSAPFAALRLTTDNITCKSLFTSPLVLALLCLGCCSSSRPLEPVPDPVTKNQALDYYNHNVRAVPDFSAKIQEWEIQFYEEQKKHHFKEGGGKLFYRPPQPSEKYAWFNLTALGGPLSQEALVVASNQQEFWMKSEPAEWSYWDTHENAGQTAPENIIIINPQLLLELIGLRPLPLEQLTPPYPIYKKPAPTD